MRPIKYITDLPWWVGLLIFVIGNVIIPFGWFGFIVGLVMCLFGCFTFAPLLPADPYCPASRMPFMIMIFSLVMALLTPLCIIEFLGIFGWSHRFTNWEYYTWAFTPLYVLRSIFGFASGIYSFQRIAKY